MTTVEALSPDHFGDAEPAKVKEHFHGIVVPAMVTARAMKLGLPNRRGQFRPCQKAVPGPSKSLVGLRVARDFGQFVFSVSQQRTGSGDGPLD